MVDSMAAASTDKFDETYYRNRYADIDQAIREGRLESGLHHFVSQGRNEGRVGARMKFQPAPLVKRPAPESKIETTVAVIVRTHRADEKFDNLMEKLERGRREFDLFAMADETKESIVRHRSNIIPFSFLECVQLGLSCERSLYDCGDFAFYAFMRNRPEYHHYLMIDDDVDFPAGDAEFMNEVCSELSRGRGRNLDFVGLEFHPASPDEGWGMGAAKRYSDLYCYYCYYPFVVLSKRAISFLFSQRQIENLLDTPGPDVVQCEGFTPSALMAGGFNCADLNELVQDCYNFELMAMQLAPDRIGFPMTYTPALPENIRVIHPVYTPEEYLRRLERKFLQDRDVDYETVRNILQRAESKSLPHDLLEGLYKRLPAEVANSCVSH